MIAFPNCKINLGLYITEKRDDGYHNLESVFYPLHICDALEVVKSETMQFQLFGTPVAGSVDDNLVLKAWRLLKEKHPIVGPVNIALLKKIPSGAGLGGGSADASAMLCLLNDLFCLHLDESTLSAYALQLGSDCPFFIRNRAAYITGRGEQYEPIALDLSRYVIVLVKPEIHIPTSWAFSQIQPQNINFSLKDLIQQPLSDWKSVLRNDFEKPVFDRYPAIAAIKEQLYDAGALYAAMSGSGSAVYGIFSHQPDISLLSSQLAPSEVFVCEANT